MNQRILTPTYTTKLHDVRILPAAAVSPVNSALVVPELSGAVFVLGRKYKVEYSIRMVSSNNDGSVFNLSLPAGIITGWHYSSLGFQPAANVIALSDAVELNNAIRAVASLVFVPSASGQSEFAIETFTGIGQTQLDAGSAIIITDIS